MCSSNSSHSKASLSRSCLLMLLNHRQENQEHEGEESEAGLARRQSKTFWGHPNPSNRLHTLCSQRTFVMGLHATHMSGECVCDGIDGFIKEEFHLGEEGEGWSQIRPLVTQEGNTHLPPNVPSHNMFLTIEHSKVQKTTMVSMFVPGLTWSVLLSFYFESWMQHSSSKRCGRNMLEVFQRGIKRHVLE